jgi:hypothetical protein
MIIIIQLAILQQALFSGRGLFLINFLGIGMETNEIGMGTNEINQPKK